MRAKQRLCSTILPEVGTNHPPAPLPFLLGSRNWVREPIIWQLSLVNWGKKKEKPTACWRRLQSFQASSARLPGVFCRNEEEDAVRHARLPLVLARIFLFGTTTSREHPRDTGNTNKGVSGYKRDFAVEKKRQTETSPIIAHIRPDLSFSSAFCLFAFFLRFTFSLHLLFCTYLERFPCCTAYSR